MSRRLKLDAPIEAAELDPAGAVVAAMIDFTAGDEISVESQAVAGSAVETVFWASRLPCGLRGTGPGGADEWAGPFRYRTVNLPRLAGR